MRFLVIYKQTFFVLSVKLQSNPESLPTKEI